MNGAAEKLRRHLDWKSTILLFFDKIKSRWREIELQKLSSDDEALMSGLEQRQEQTRVNYSTGILLNHSTCKKLLMAFLQAWESSGPTPN